MTIWITTGEASALLRRAGLPVERLTVARMCDAGSLPSTRLRPGGWRYVDRDAVLALIPQDVAA